MAKEMLEKKLGGVTLRHDLDRFIITAHPGTKEFDLLMRLIFNGVGVSEEFPSEAAVADFGDTIYKFGTLS